MRLAKKSSLLAGGIAAFSAVGLLAASPALAVGGVLAPVLGTGTSGPHKITAGCTADAGVTTNINQITYAVTGFASAYSTNGSYGVGTGITCIAYNTAYPYTQYGAISGGDPGPEGVAAGLITVPTNKEVALCYKANATFSDGGSAHADNCPF